MNTNFGKNNRSRYEINWYAIRDIALIMHITPPPRPLSTISKQLVVL